MCTGAPRLAKNLKTKYLNLKADMKKRSAENKKYTYGTGGGPAKEQAASEFDILLGEILPQEQVGGMKSMYDNDSQVSQNKYEDLDHSLYSDPEERYDSSKKVVEIQSPHVEIDCESNDMNVPCQQSTSKRLRTSSPTQATAVKDGATSSAQFEPWEHYTSDQLKTPKNKKLCSESVTKKQTSWARLAEIKAKWTEIKFKEDLQFSKTEHTLRITHMNETQELQKRFATEKHALEIRILEDRLKKN